MGGVTMNAFEYIVKRYLEGEGYWVRQSVKVYILKEDKVAIGTPSMPTPEIDIVAFNVKKNELLLVEAKSYLYSYGVYYEAIANKKDKAANRYKLFTNTKFRERVTKQLKKQLLSQGLINEDTRINYTLAAGNIHSGNEEALIEYFFKKSWLLITPNQIKSFVKGLINSSWENDLVTITTKLLK
jgi:hypothetical protein